MITLSFAVTACDELSELSRLLKILVNGKRSVDEIVVLLDVTKTNARVLSLLTGYEDKHDVKLITEKFEGDFAAWKNKLSSHCSGDFIFQIDADEYPSENLVSILPELIRINPTIDVYRVPRINTVEGITEQHVAKWGWRISPEGWINFPDKQWRIYRNVPYIKWVNKVHERLDGFKTLTELPAETPFCLYHPKTIDRQERQNDYYSTL